MIDINEKIKACNKCGDLPKLTCNTIKKGNCNVLVLGESPSKDGWLVSGRAFYNKDGVLQASGKVLNKLLNICGLNIDDIYFTECCKCIIKDRKTLSTYSANCKEILFSQLESIPCDIILPMGKYPTETLLNRKVNKLSDFVGKQFFINIGEERKIVIPIFHPSPISPLSYKGNEPIFYILRDLLNDKQ